jgi:hypothetical protein
MEQKSEPRKDTRAGVGSGLAIRIDIDAETRLGLLTDISIAGLAARYINLDYTLISPGRACRLKLLDGSGKVILDGIPARVVYDRDATNEYPYTLHKMNKIGIAFDDLPYDQAGWLELLLSSLRGNESHHDD